MTGPRVDLVGVTKLPYGQIPVLLHNGEVTLQTQSGKLGSIALDTHAYLFIDAIEGKTQKEVRGLTLPVLLHNGEVTLQTQSGKLGSIALDTHAYLFIDAIKGISQKEVRDLVSCTPDTDI